MSTTNVLSEMVVNGLETMIKERLSAMVHHQKDNKLHDFTRVFQLVVMIISEKTLNYTADWEFLPLPHDI